jgi:hypothetical protein
MKPFARARAGALAVAATLLLAAACGGPNRSGDDVPGDDTPDPPDAFVPLCTPSATMEGPGTCSDGFDNDCDEFIDCTEVECVGVDGCPAAPPCEISTPMVSLSLPDGNCTGTAPPPGSPDPVMEAFLATCGAYEATFPLTGFPAGGTLTDPTKLLGVCVNMEHSWLRDLQMEAYCPNGTRVLLSKFAGQTGGEWYLGQANDADSSSMPIPGVGWDYCWTHNAGYPAMIPAANMGFPSPLPSGDYTPSEPLTGFLDCPLNGDWKIRVIDGWGIDNGFIFQARFVFDQSLADDCPVIE